VIWVVLAVAAVAALLYWFHNHKKGEPVSYYVTTPSLWVSIPAGVPREQGEKIATTLDDTRRAAWARFEHIYQETPRSTYVSTVNVVHGTVHKDHPYVMWYAGGDRIRISLRNDMMRWWLLELHNVYRYGLHGYDGIYLSENATDKERLRYSRAVRYCKNYAERVAA